MEYNIYMISFYYKDCPNCKNAARNLVRECGLQKNIKIDERYIFALPDVWGEEAERIGEPLPFLYNDDLGTTLHVDATLDNMREQVENFINTL